MRTLMKSTNLAYGIKHQKERKLFSMFFISFIFAIVFLVMIIVTLIMIVTGSFIVNLLIEIFPIMSKFEIAITFMRFCLTILPMFLSLIFFYKIAPARKIRIKTVIPGAIFSVTAIMIASVVFSFYVSNMGNYSVLYGSMGAVLVLMLWLYILGVITILGSEINATYLQRKILRKIKKEIKFGLDIEKGLIKK